MKAPIFLSASVPDPKRDERYCATADVTAIRESVRALVAAVVPHARLVFGGHPAITPLVALIATQLGRPGRVRVYQSAFFAKNFPQENTAFRNIIVVPPCATRDDSLLKMRRKMISSEKFCAGIFIGGMEGAEQEMELFEELHPRAIIFPIASTGGAARLRFDANIGPTSAAVRQELLTNDVYGTLFARLLQQVWHRPPGETSRSKQS